VQELEQRWLSEEKFEEKSGTEKPSRNATAKGQKQK
jgi:hypothetical protein